MSQHIDPPMMQASVVDNLTTNDGTKALSAKQGYVLNSNLINIDSGTYTVIVNFPSTPTGGTYRTSYSFANKTKNKTVTINSATKMGGGGDVKSLISKEVYAPYCLFYGSDSALADASVSISITVA